MERERKLLRKEREGENVKKGERRKRKGWRRRERSSERIGNDRRPKKRIAKQRKIWKRKAKGRKAVIVWQEEKKAKGTGKGVACGDPLLQPPCLFWIWSFHKHQIL